MLFYITTTTQIKSGEVDSKNVWGIINVVVLFWEFKTGSGTCEWSEVKCSSTSVHVARVWSIHCVPSDKVCGGNRVACCGFETLYSTWVPDQDETPHIFIVNRAMDLYCRGCRLFCLYIFCWKAHHRKVKISLCYFDLFLNFTCISILVDWGFFSSNFPWKSLLQYCWIWQEYKFQCARVEYMLE